MNSQKLPVMINFVLGPNTVKTIIHVVHEHFMQVYTDTESEFIIVLAQYCLMLAFTVRIGIKISPKISTSKHAMKVGDYNYSYYHYFSNLLVMILFSNVTF